MARIGSARDNSHRDPYVLTVTSEDNRWLLSRTNSRRRHCPMLLVTRIGARCKGLFYSLSLISNRRKPLALIRDIQFSSGGEPGDLLNAPPSQARQAAAPIRSKRRPDTILRELDCICLPQMIFWVTGSAWNLERSTDNKRALL